MMLEFSGANSDDIGIGRLGINARRKNDRIIFTYPISIFIGTKVDKDVRL